MLDSVPPKKGEKAESMSQHHFMHTPFPAKKAEKN